MKTTANSTASKPVQLTHFNAMGNVYWTFLQESNTMHITARQKHGQLLDQLEKDGISFDGITKFLLAEAKRAGLHRCCKYDSKTGKMRYLTNRELKSHAWYHELSTFSMWVKANWRAYGVKKDRVPRKNDKRACILTRKKSTSVVERTDINGATIEDIKSGNTIDKTVQANADNDDEAVKGSGVNASFSTGSNESATDSKPERESETGHKGPIVPDSANVMATTGSSMTAPITAELTPMQIQQLVLQNLDVLGKLSLEKGAKAEFNALMNKLGAVDLVIS